MRTKLSKNNFISGVLSNSLNGRYDLPIYNNGVAFSDNFQLSFEGGLQKRTGYKYIIDTEEAYYIKFVFN